MTCHAKPDCVKKDRDKTLSMTVRLEDLKRSVHDGIRCVACHRDIQKPDHKDEKLAPARCDVCHADEDDAHALSAHARPKAGGPEVARCTDCHGTHAMLSRKHPESPVHKFSVPKTCARCHSDPALMAKHKVRRPEAPTEFVSSVHGHALLDEGLAVAPSCVDCHGVHEIRRAADRKATIHKTRISATCGVCHVTGERECAAGPHAALVAKGDEKGPTCITCHSAHAIREADDSLEAKQTSVERCASCHEDRRKTYDETYHGKAMALGYPDVAACYDCHGNHAILAASKPGSKIGPQSILTTCQACHPKATASFTQFHAHADPTDRKAYPVLYWTYLFMMALLFGTFGFFGLHALLWLARTAVLYVRNPQALREARAHARTDAEWFSRFTPFQRFLHYLIIVSFMLLVLTGMPLRYSYTGWAKAIMAALGGVPVARTLHRIGAIVTFGYFGLHILAMLAQLWRGRAAYREPSTSLGPGPATGRFRMRRFLGVVFGADSPLPNLQDLRDFAAHVKWFFGRGPRPQWDRWTYWEKFDYFAVFWGVAIIGLSGLIMWASQASTRFLPGWMINVAHIVHSDEALLAAGFIFSIHFFNNHLRPEKFPMDPIMFSGRITKAEMMHTRRRWYDRLVASGQLDAWRVKDEWGNWRSLAHLFGYAAVALGVVLLVLILCAIL
jgi:thiosulfate reductase cytochrome b subunit